MAATDSGLGLLWSGDQTTAPFLHFLMTDFFSQRLNNAKNNSATLLSFLPSSSQYVSGKHIIEPVKYGRNNNAFNRVREGGLFPDPGQTKARVYAYRSRIGFVRFIIEGSLMRRSRSDITRYVDPIVDLFSDFQDDYMVEKNRQMHSDGSGRLAEIASGTASATQTLRHNQDILTAGVSASAPDWEPTTYLAIGDRVMIVDPTGGTVRANVTVSSITSASVVVFSAIVTTTTGDWIVRVSNDDSTAAAQVNSSGFRTEPMGLGGIFQPQGVLDGHGAAAEVATAGAQQAYTWSGVDDFATVNRHFFQGLPASPAAAGWTSEFSFNQGIVYHNSGTLRAPTESLIQRACSQTIKRNNAEVNLYLSNYEVQDTYMDGLLPEKRYVNTVELMGGWGTVPVGPKGYPWAVDRMCPENRMYGLALESGGFMSHVVEPLGWATEQGASIWQYLQDTDVYQARMVEDDCVGVGVRDRCGFALLDLSQLTGP